MLRIETKNDLQRLIDDEVQESLTLDYKASPALAKDNRSRDELCKDVTAFANSAGGQIVYGIKEENRKPTGIDQGSDLTREWIEQVGTSKNSPQRSFTTKLPSNDSGLFPLRFADVHSRRVRDRHWNQFFEVPR